jgi:hypothetical protein
MEKKSAHKWRTIQNFSEFPSYLKRKPLRDEYIIVFPILCGPLAPLPVNNLVKSVLLDVP